MVSGTFFDYYYGGESDQFPFYRIPQQLIAGKDFQHVSAEAKLLYGLLLDRMLCPPKMAGTINWGAYIFILRWQKYRKI